MQLLSCMHLMFVFVLFAYTGIKSASFLCWMLRIVGQEVSIKCLMAALSDCFPSSSCLLLSEYWNLVPNNISVRVKTKIWLPFKTWRSLSVPIWAAYHTGNWNSWCLDWENDFIIFKLENTRWKMRIENDWCVVVCKATVQLCSIYWRSYSVSRTRVRGEGP